MRKLIPFLALILLVPTAHAANVTVPSKVIMHFDGNALNAVDNFEFNTVGTVAYDIGVAGRSDVNFGNANTKNLIEADYSYGVDGGDVSMGAWVKLNAQAKPGHAYTFAMQSSNNSKVRYSLSYQKANGLYMACFNRNAVGVSQINSCSVVDWKPGEWHQITGVRSGSENYLYIDGAQTSHNTSAPVNGTADVWNEVSFGALHYTSATSTYYANFASARIDEAFVAASAITSSTVSSLYNNGMLAVVFGF